jgi:hypothetical protein
MAPLPVENPNRLVNSRQSIGIHACHVSPDCRSIEYFGRSIDNVLDRISWLIDRKYARSNILVERSTLMLEPLCAFYVLDSPKMLPRQP